MDFVAEHYFSNHPSKLFKALSVDISTLGLENQMKT